MAVPTTPPESGGWLRTHLRAVDAAVLVLLVAVQVVGLFGYRQDAFGYAYRAPDALGVVLAVAAVLPLWWRHRYPSSVAVAVAALGTLSGVLGYAGLGVTFTVLIATYTAGAEAPLRRSLPAALASAACVVGYVLWLRGEYPRPDVIDGVQVLSGALLVIGMWGVGRGVRGRRLYTRALEQRAERLERARALEVRAALAEERGRIARELHDVVAHHVAVMTVQASAARRTAERDPAASREAMAAVESTGRAALEEMRRLVGVLRGPDEDAAAGSERPRADLCPSPGLAELDRLVEQVRDAGLPVELRCTGDPRPLPAGLDLAAYRAVQEALTNALKHAGPTSAEVHLDWAPDALHVRVRDRGRGPHPGHADDAGPPGHGLLGMRERLGLYGGKVSAGAARGGGYEVCVSIPLEPPATALAGWAS